jgi:uncharacterized protein GlcG (DUF336 family)
MEPRREDGDASDEQQRPQLKPSRRRFLEGGGAVLGIAALSGEGSTSSINTQQPALMSQTPTTEGASQLRTTREIPLEMAKKIMDAAEQKACQMGLAQVITVTNAEGNLIAQRRMDDAWLPSVSISRQKAYTAAGLEMPTHNLAEPTQPGESLWGLHTTDENKLVIFGGGYPLEADGEVVGAIGASGGAVSQDRKVAEAGVDRFNKLVN